MKIIGLFFVLLFMSYISISQDKNTSNFNGIIKTNIATWKDIQQYSLSIETKSKHPKQTNCFMIGGHLLTDDKVPFKRNALYLSYRRNFYFEPVFSKHNIYIAPYSKLIFRDVVAEGFDIFSGPFNYTSTSVALGGDLGINFNLSKRVLLGIKSGMGLGYVLNYTIRERYTASPTDIHLDMHGLIEIGFNFGKAK